MSVDLDQFTEDFIGVSEFSDRAIVAMEKLQASEVHFPRPRDVKNLIEEIWPMAIFARSLDLPQQRISIRYSGNSPDDPDGKISILGQAGRIDVDYELETTVAEHKSERLHRELLATTGAAFHDLETDRVGSRWDPDSYIKNEPKVVDGDAPIRETVDVVRIAIRKKLAKKYRPLRILIIVVNSGWSLTVADLCEVAREAQSDELRANFAGIYLICPHSAFCVPVEHLWKKDRVEEWAKTNGFAA